MDIIVCVKHVPETAEVDIKVDDTGKRIEEKGLIFGINEWDEYAVEEAILIKEKLGGTVTVITVGPEEADNTLRICLAKGADNAIRITDPKLKGSDGFVIAKILSSVIKDLPFDLILTGAQASDDGYAIVGPALAELLGIPHVTLVKKIELENGIAKVVRELEGGLGEIVEVKLPAVLTIQTGINNPRYVSLIKVRRVMKKEIKVLSLADIGLSEDEVGESGSWIRIEKMYTPPAEKQAEFIEGSPEEIATKLIEIIKSKGLL